MTGTGDAGQTRLPGRVARGHRRERDVGHPRRDDPYSEVAGDIDDEPDDELDAVTRLMGFLRQGDER